ncbi:T-lymphocyte activation antigen CD80-like isoform X5 [Syngnathus typhle]|uniref:T-lymphocyte activation antigen CD80-like isoform X5 n=1 Tax=Syngnathus typhle TaxID=161592 RepID=UPI002A6A6780|nr:T-lymphocyte activation antigen CD80-like isoform X5 [Syngnathus typhle]
MLWSTGLLLSFFFTCCNAWDVECVLGIVGRPLRLSCFYREALTLANVSVEWRRNENKVVGDEDDNDDALTGNFTLSLPTVDPQEDNASYSVIISARENRSLEACSLCVRVAAPFSAPELRWEAAEENVPSVFQCDSGGGFPKPVLDWLIDDGAQEIPEGSVQTQVELREDSRLYHITSYLSVNVTDNNVSCVVHNTLLNQTLTSTTRMWDVTAGDAVWHGPVVTRARDALWVFSTALCVVVGIMVAVGLGYQIHLDRVSKRKKIQHLSRRDRAPSAGYHRRRQQSEETEVVTLHSWESNV